VTASEIAAEMAAALEALPGLSVSASKPTKHGIMFSVTDADELEGEAPDDMGEFLASLDEYEVVVRRVRRGKAVKPTKAKTGGRS
jgi:hypothetical protein